MMPANIGTRIWLLLWPVRKPLSALLYVLSRLVHGLSVALWGIQVGIDFLRLIYLDYKPRPDDIFIVTYPRSGTTWMQMILYQLTTDGDMDFAHIGQVCPWFERVAVNKRDLEAIPSPRVFKSHLPQWGMPRRAPRCIYVAREGKDVAVSFYHFLKSHFRYQGDFPAFFKLFMRGWLPWGSWFGHVAGWWARRDDPRVLFLWYEDLARDLEGEIRRIIEFCELDVPEERISEVVDRCRFSAMKGLEDKFDFATEHMLELGYSREAFLRSGRVGDWQSLFSNGQLEEFGNRFERKLGRRGVRK